MKSRTTAILLCLFLGWLGIHNFYLNRNARGLIQLMILLFFSWLIIPFLALVVWVFIEFIVLITTDDSDFNKEFNSVE